MARVSQVLVILVVALAIAKPFSLPPAKFLKDFALKYQRSSIVMSIPKEISLNHVVKRYVTPPIAEILCVKNGRVIVVCGFLMK